MIARILLILVFPIAFLAFWISLFFISKAKIELVLREIGKLAP